MYELLGIDINTLNDGGFKFFQNGLIRKVLEYTFIDNCNRLPIPTNIEAPIGTDENGSEAKRDWSN